MGVATFLKTRFFFGDEWKKEEKFLDQRVRWTWALWFSSMKNDHLKISNQLSILLEVGLYIAKLHSPQYYSKGCSKQQWKVGGKSLQTPTWMFQLVCPSMKVREGSLRDLGTISHWTWPGLQCFHPLLCLNQGLSGVQICREMGEGVTYFIGQSLLTPPWLWCIWLGDWIKIALCAPSA